MTENTTVTHLGKPVYRWLISGVLLLVGLAAGIYRGSTLREESRQLVIVIEPGTAEQIEAGLLDNSEPRGDGPKALEQLLGEAQSDQDLDAVHRPSLPSSRCRARSLDSVDGISYQTPLMDAVHGMRVNCVHDPTARARSSRP